MPEDVFQNTQILAANWSNDVVIGQMSGGGESCTIQAVAPAPISITGVVSAMGDLIEVTAPASYGPTSFSASAVFPVEAGLVVQDQFGDYLLISSGPVQVGAVLDSVSSFGQYSSGGTPCIVAGTSIRSSGRWVLIEHLRPGDCATSVSGEAQRIVWIGRKVVHLAAGCDPATLPVLFKAGCLSPGCPRADLMLSPDHAVWVAGCLVPAYRLCNGSSIRRHDVPTIVYYHVELVRHGILLAEGLPVESYLDAGNRRQFDTGTGQLPTDREHNDMAAWARYACAPPLTDPASMACVRRNLHQRALRLGYNLVGPDIELRLNGRPAAYRRQGDTLSVVLPRGTQQVVLHSRTSRPSEVVDDAPDHRRLGIAVSDLAIGGTPVPMQDDALFATGWHLWEGEFRWTSGQAVLPINPVRSPTLLTLRVRTWLRYWHRGGRLIDDASDVDPRLRDVARPSGASAALNPL